ncbi:MAG: fdxN element excision recombinase XisF [Cyanobacteria bacterium J06635_10]
MHIFFYGRVSTLEQQEDGRALQKQLERGKAAGATRFYWDIISRSSETRPGLQAMMEDLVRFKVDELMIARIDRIGSSSKLFYSLLGILRTNNIKLKALDQNLDVNSSGGQLTIDILLAASKFEVGMLSDRLKAERSYRRSKGKSNACIAPFGWKTLDGVYVPDTSPCVCIIKEKLELQTCDLAKLALEKFYQHPSTHALSKYLNEMLGCTTRSKSTAKKQQNVTENLQEIDFSRARRHGYRRYPHGSLGWTPAGIKNWLVNPVHAGGIPRNSTSGSGKGYKSFDEWNVDWGTHEGIISREYHEEIKAIIRGNRSNHWASRNMNMPNPYANLLKCSNCGGAVARCSIRLLKTKGYVAYFQCVRYGQGQCNQRAMLRNDKLDTQLQEHLIKRAEALANALNFDEEIEEPPKLLRLRQDLAQLEKCSPNPAIERAKCDINNQIRAIKSSYMPKSIPQRERFIEMFADQLFWNTLTNEEKKRVLRDFVRCIWVNGSNLGGIDLLF